MESQKDFIEKTLKKIFKITQHSDIYAAVGKIIEAAQDWEEDYKELAKKLKADIKNVNKSSLNRLNIKLHKENKLTNKEYDDLAKVIDLRNYINHVFFLEIKREKMSYEEIGKKLSDILFLIQEADDVVCNKIDALKGSSIIRPTVFDEDNKK